MTASGPAAALDDLAAALDAGEFITALVTGSARRPCLTVARRHTHLTAQVYACSGWFWWGWAERIAPTTQVTAAASAVTATLRTPGHQAGALAPTTAGGPA